MVNLPLAAFLFSSIVNKEGFAIPIVNYAVICEFYIP